jgi:hypothetical protein
MKYIQHIFASATKHIIIVKNIEYVLRNCEMIDF